MKEREVLLQGCFLLTCLGCVQANYSMDFCPAHCYFFFFNILYMLQTTLPGLVCSSVSSEKAEFDADVVTVNYPQSQSPLDLNPFPGGPPDG